MLRLGLVLAAIVLAVVFAAQNADVVNLSFLAWNLDASLAVIIVLGIASGALIAALAMAPSLYRDRTGRRKLNQRLAELEDRHRVHGDEVRDPIADTVVPHNDIEVSPPSSRDTGARLGGV